jgi:hypothetical protein
VTVWIPCLILQDGGRRRAGGQAMGGMGNLGEVGGKKRPQAPDAYQPALTPVEESDKGWVGWEKGSDSLAVRKAKR